MTESTQGSPAARSSAGPAADGRVPWTAPRSAHDGPPADGRRFARVPETQWGYGAAEVDDFLDRVAALLAATEGYSATLELGSRQIRERVFDRERGGYQPAAVDARLDELEERLALREREAFIAEHGPERWAEHLELLGRTLLGRLERPHGERFRRPSRRQQLGYSVADVDVLCDRLVEHLRSDERLDPAVVRNAVFRQAQGHRCYEEQQVDAFLDRAVELILALR